MSQQATRKSSRQTPSHASSSMDTDEIEVEDVRTLSNLQAETIAALQSQLVELRKEMEALRPRVQQAPSATPESGTHVELSSQPASATTESSPPPPKRRAIESLEDANLPMVEKWTPQTEWFSLMAPTTPASKNREILSALEVEATLNDVSKETLFRRILQLASNSPDAVNFLLPSRDGYALLQILRKSIETQQVVDKIVVRERQSAEQFFKEVIPNLPEEMRKLENRTEALQQIALRDRTVNQAELRKLHKEIAKEDNRSTNAANIHFHAQLKRLWEAAKIDMRAPLLTKSSYAHQPEHDHRKRKNRGRATDLEIESPESSSSSSSSSGSSKKNFKKRVPARPCKFCDAAKVPRDKSMHFDADCKNEEAKAAWKKIHGPEN